MYSLPRVSDRLAKDSAFAGSPYKESLGERSINLQSARQCLVSFVINPFDT